MTTRIARRGIFGRGQPILDPATEPGPPPTTRWDNVGLAVGHAMDVFLAATAGIPAIRRIDAKSSGPTIHFLVTVDGPWDHVVDRIEGRLFPLAKAGELPPLDYDVREGGEPEPGYLQVFPD